MRNLLYNFNVKNWLLILIVSLNALIIETSEATYKKSKKKIVTSSSPIQTSLVVNGKTGKILYEQNARQKIYPASLTKVMTVYLMFEALESGRLSIHQRLPVPEYASKANPTKLYLKPGEHITVQEAIKALIVKSANDVARTVAEGMAGSESRFAKIMTIRAHQLGMKNTTFANASGLHDPRQKTTAIDLAKLAIAVKRDFPQYYHYFSETSFNFKGKTINGHNKLTAMYQGAEGLKTGYTGPAGRNLITTATRGHKSLVGVVTGSPSNVARDSKMVALLDKHFGVKKIQSDSKKIKDKKIRVVSSSRRN